MPLMKKIVIIVELFSKYYELLLKSRRTVGKKKRRKTPSFICSFPEFVLFTIYVAMKFKFNGIVFYGFILIYCRLIPDKTVM